MELKIESYVLQSLNTIQWKSYKESFDSLNPIFRIKSENLTRFSPLTKTHYETLSNTLKKRVVFINDITEINSNAHNGFVAIQGKLKNVSQKQPYPKTFKLECRGCKTKWNETVSVPILNPDANSFLCGKFHCSHYLQNRPLNNAEITHIDVIEGTLVNKNTMVRVYLQNNPTYGFEEISAKIFDAVKRDAPITVYGYCSIHKIERKSEYFVEIIDIDLHESESMLQLIPFYTSEVPTNEKEMVMTSFFINIEYMKSYLNFQKYKLQQRYPDLILYDDMNNERVVEFEYDVANFYYHKHYEQTPTCDLIIAWQCSTKRTDFPYLLLSELKGTYITNTRVVKFNQHQILESLLDVLLSLYPEVNSTSIQYLIFLVIDFPMPMRTILNTNQIELSYSITVERERIKFLNDTESRIKLSERGKNKILLEKRTENDKVLNVDNVFKVKDYISYITSSRIQSPILYEKNVINNLYSMYNDFERVDFVLVLINLLANFYQLHEITNDFVEFFFNMFPQFLNK